MFWCVKAADLQIPPYKAIRMPLQESGRALSLGAGHNCLSGNRLSENCPARFLTAGG
jgi:hypothetical protein